MEKNEEKVKIRGIKKTQNSTFLKLCIVCFFFLQPRFLCFRTASSRSLFLCGCVSVPSTSHRRSRA